MTKWHGDTEFFEIKLFYYFKIVTIKSSSTESMDLPCPKCHFLESIYIYKNLLNKIKLNTIINLKWIFVFMLSVGSWIWGCIEFGKIKNYYYYY